MSKQKKTIILLCAALATLVVAYVALNFWNKAQEEKEAAEDESSVIYLAQMDDISEISYEYSGETLNFTKNGDGNWEYAEDASFPLDSTAITSIETSLSSLTALREFENQDGLEAYGLETSTNSLSARSSDGTEFKLIIGSVTGTGSGNYAYVEGKDTIYTVSDSVLSSISYSLMDLVEADTIPTFSEDNIETVTLTTSDSTVSLKKETFTYETEADTGDENSETEQVTEYTWHFVSGETSTEIPSDSPVLENVLSDLSALTFVSCYNYNATDADLEECSLLSPVYTITVTDTDGNETSLYIGSTDENGYYYASSPGSSMINTMVNTSVSSVIALDRTVTLSADEYAIETEE